MVKYYAIAVGRQPGIYTDWPTAESQVKGYSGAKYKSFATQPEAESYLSSQSVTPMSAPLSPSPPLTAAVKLALKCPQPPPNQTIIYTDGSADPSGKAGYGFVVLRPGAEPEHYAGKVPYHPSTNQQAELIAILSALQTVPTGPVLIRSDSQYAINSLTVWHKEWERNGWLNSNRNPVENQDLIRAVLAEMRLTPRQIQFEHVRAHCGNTYNELADSLAKQGKDM